MGHDKFPDRNGLVLSTGDTRGDILEGITRDFELSDIDRPSDGLVLGLIG